MHRPRRDERLKRTVQLTVGWLIGLACHPAVAEVGPLGHARSGPIEATALRAALGDALSQSAFVEVAISFAGSDATDGSVVEASEYDLRGWFPWHRPDRAWVCSRVPEPACVDALELLGAHAAEVISMGWEKSNTKPLADVLRLAFHRTSAITVGAEAAPIRISEATQRHLTLEGVSDYDARSSVIVIEEPHYDATAQLALMQGLRGLMGDNPALSAADGAVFLAEGWPRGEALQTAPLSLADPSPTEDTIQALVENYLLPGYLAFAWRSCPGMRVTGVEDPALYELSARSWVALQTAASPQSAAAWRATVAARNGPMTAAVAEEVAKGRQPLLFVGGLHMYALSPADRSALQGTDAWASLGPSGAELVQRGGSGGLLGMLHDRGIGYAYLTTRCAPFADPERLEDEVARYTALFRSQLAGDTDEFLSEYLGVAPPAGVTVAPAVSAAAKVLSARKGGRPPQEGGGKAKAKPKPKGEGKPEAKPRGRWGKDQLWIDKDGKRRMGGPGGPIVGPDGAIDPAQFHSKRTVILKALADLCAEIIGFWVPPK